MLTEANKLDQADVLAQVTALKGDLTKLATGATLPTDLVAAANEIAQLKADKVSLDEAVAKRIVALGFTDPNAKKTGATADAGQKKLSYTEQVLQAKGCKDLAELEAKHNAELAKIQA